jgi:hypothetical protein
VITLGLLAAAAFASPTASATASAASPSVDRAAGLPTYVKGRVVDADTGARLRGVHVTVRDPVSLRLIGSDFTDRRGVFRVGGLHSDEYAVKFNGSRRGFETGFGACGHRVVPHYGAACTFAPGAVGKFRLDRL